MMAVPRRPRRAADEADQTPANGAAPPPENPPNGSAAGAQQTPGAGATGPKPTAGNTSAGVPPAATPDSPPNGSENHADTALVPVKPTDGPHLEADPGLYAVLRLDPSASDAEIQTAYRRQAAKLLSNGATNTHAMRELNVAYEVLGNPVRRVEYDRLRLSQALSPGAPTPIRPGAKAAARITRRTRPRQVVQPRYAGLGDVLVVLMVVGLAVLAGVLIIPRLSINLSALNALQNVLPLTNNTRRVIDTTVTPVPATAVPTATPRPGVAERFTGTTVSVSNPSPAQNTAESVVIKLRRDGQPAANFDVWANVQYRTTQERWPATGTVKTDPSGTATITFNIGATTPNYPVQVRVFAQVDDQQLSWSTSFTPH
jgi:DnaJ-like protein